MARDDSKLEYSSAWNIDQLIENNEKDVTTGDNVLFTNSLVPFTPFFQVYFKPSGDTRWFQCGDSSTNGSYTGRVSVFSYILGNQVHINANTNGRARWFVWADKVDY